MNTSRDVHNVEATQLMRNHHMQVNEDEIDLAEYFQVLWKYKWFILLVSFGVALVTAIISFQIPNQYRAQVVMVPVNSASSGGLSNLASKYGGLASMAGISLPDSGDDRTSQALGVLKSRKFINDFIGRLQLKPALFPERWDEKTSSWKVEAPGVTERLRDYMGMPKGQALSYDGQESLESGEPSMWEAFEVFKGRIMTVSQDKESGAITLSIQWYSPVDVRNWANRLVDDLNDRLRNEMIENSERTIRYLKEQIKQTNLLELREILFGLIEEHVKNITLAKTNTEYVFKVIDPAVVPEEKSKPKRGLIIAAAFFLGLIISSFIVFFRNWKRNTCNATEKLES
ncbi:Wzz/FepE/Etk N-terminal domain-containing protein [Thiomicrorhabdus sp. ZW0627]|uniref:Wzz/FepE/Etk N-terminal domain-containing protein n=1 Tax=Thiomicrorhabdus sp. ZW0627 TaxID=3039774 RepID=UPI002436EFE9|nr:Wzz/FepE/Etk N-terminal domain-containing protein [Thiomicrorhabdus sp. ZW0627]MDG6773610.1 Wzz/FepE/Etk N-terminal domain-containing protein [Thiomicrorhabdus sp. ZW0627]